MMKLLDLSQFISQTMPVYPNTPHPQLDPACTLEEHGFRETGFAFSSHTGTHIDAPWHLIPGGLSLEKMPVERFFGLAFVLDVREYAGGEIPLEALLEHEDQISCCDFLLLRSGWDQYWGQDKYFRDYPVLSLEAARWLAGLSRLSGVGVDMISVDPEPSEELPVHHILLEAGKINIENLCKLFQIKDDLAMLSVLPLKYRDADGSPVRAVAFQMDAF